MKEIMGYDECKNKHLLRVQPDPEKIKSILKLASVRLKAINQIKQDKETASVIAEGYYGIIKELLTALLLKNGLRSDNHECLISFFKRTYPEYEYETRTIHELKVVRNSINYQGIFVKEQYLNNNRLEFEHIIKLLRNLLQ